MKGFCSYLSLHPSPVQISEFPQNQQKCFHPVKWLLHQDKQLEMQILQSCAITSLKKKRTEDADDDYKSVKM